MTKTLAHGLDIDALFEQQGGMRLAQSVQCDRRRIRLS